MKTVTPVRGTIRGAARHHGVDADRVAALADSMRANGYDESRPVLCLEDCGNGAYILDGHHRHAAARAAGIEDVPALIVADADMGRLLDAEFGGELPARLEDLDAYILVDGAGYDGRG